jgi:hypothetical protein
MSHTVILHLANEDPILAEMDKLPERQDTILVITNPRRRDGKQIDYINPEATDVIFPMTKITFVEVFPTEEEESEIVEFFRD